ncbi:hypothetical protein L6452_20839 [Arctium lappa]|uniref:Uncharacterized protein n=1 Tax=Arctium lappa TaxID=4217 RepID=A0ACB9BDB5_ARCLA|nr:hypothetical protein L6452_20839 [Arctium lappa]
MSSSTRSGTVEDEEWEDRSTTVRSETAVTTTVTAAPSSVVSGFSKISVPPPPQARWRCSWSSTSKMNVLGKLDCDEMVGDAVVGGGGSHCSTVERLYAWEKKLCQEVKVMNFIISFSCFF